MKKLLFLCVVFFCFSFTASAHPGRTAGDGCHYCWTNCAKWGEVYGERHCHNGTTTAPTISYPILTPSIVDPETSWIFVSKNFEKTYTKSSIFITGKTTDNCSILNVTAKDSYGSVFDDYDLLKYEYGDTSFKYGIATKWDNLKKGKNTYTFTAYCDHGSVQKTSITLYYYP